MGDDIYRIRKRGLYKMKKRNAILVLALALVLALTGCSKSETSSANVAGSAAAPTLNPDGSFHLPIVDKPETFSIFATLDNMAFDPSWPVWQEIAQKTNINLEGYISLSNSNQDEAFNLMLSSNLADIISYANVSDMEKLGADGGLIPLNDLIDEYAPHIKAYMESHPNFKQFATALDGNIYFIPKDMTTKSSQYYWIRKDWLDKLGLEVPTTVDELETVLYAFRNDDPNGNGIKDEIPYFDRAGWKMADESLYLWDSSTEFYFRDGKAEFEPLTENFKTAVRNISRWYKDGILDPEIFTRGGKSRDILFSQNVGGFTHDWVSTSEYNDKVSIPGFEVVAIAPPANQHGVVKERAVRGPLAGWGISSTCKDPIAVIKLFDYMFTEEGSDYMNWGIEGVSYKVNEDGSKTFLKENCGDLPAVGFMRQLGAIYCIGFSQNGEYEAATRNDAGNYAVELYESHDEWYEEAMALPPYSSMGELDMKIFPEDLSRFRKIMNTIDPYVKEKLQSWVLGTSDFDADYDAFVAELHKRGIDEATAIIQKAYDRFLESK